METVETAFCKLWLLLCRGQWFKILCSVLMLELLNMMKVTHLPKNCATDCTYIHPSLSLFSMKEISELCFLHSSLNSTRPIDFKVNPSWSKNNPLFMYSAVSTGSLLTMPQTKFRQLWKRWLVATCKLWTGI